MNVRMHFEAVQRWPRVLADHRIPTLVTGVALAALAPWLVWRLRGWHAWTLGALAWTWGWSRILISFALPPADLWTRLMVYAFIATVAAGFAAAAALLWEGTRRRVAVAAIAAVGLAFEVWYLLDHPFFLDGLIAVLNLVFPLTLAALGAAGVAAWVHAGRLPEPAGRGYVWLGTGLLLLPAFRSFQSGLSLAVSPFWKTSIGRAEAGLFGAALLLVVIGAALAVRRPGSDRALSVVLAGVIVGAAVASLSAYLEPNVDRLLLFYLDGAAAAAAVAGLAALSLGKTRADAAR